MTTLENQTQLLFNMGLFQPQAEAIMKVAVEELNESVNVNWNDDITGYPPAIQGMIHLAIKPIALNWIEENCPNAWFKEMFVD